MTVTGHAINKDLNIFQFKFGIAYDYPYSSGSDGIIAYNPTIVGNPLDILNNDHITTTMQSWLKEQFPKNIFTNIIVQSSSKITKDISNDSIMKNITIKYNNTTTKKNDIMITGKISYNFTTKQYIFNKN